MAPVNLTLADRIVPVGPLDRSLIDFYQVCRHPKLHLTFCYYRPPVPNPDSVMTILAIDQGTTSSRAIVFSTAGEIMHVAQAEFTQIYPADGWVEHDPDAIRDTTMRVCREVLSQTSQMPTAIGITNQRETTIVWDRNTGEPVYNAIVWQDRRTATTCEELKSAGHEELVVSKTGLLLDPYFSGTKLAWILNNVEGARARAERGELAFGTVDSFVLWHLTGGKEHATDATNASRTMLFNIETQEWDDELLAMLNIPRSLLPEVKDCAARYGTSTTDAIGARIPITGIAGDQQAALIGQLCFEPGMMKSTYGTGCFAIINTGNELKRSTNRLLSTVGYRLDGNTTYALEGSIFIAGAAVQWLRDGIGVIKNASDTEAMARSLEGEDGVYLVPAFTGLGAPYWDPHARGALFGLTRDSGPATFARAALDSVCYQTNDLLGAIKKDGISPNTLRVDGGMVANNWVLDRLADICDCPVERPAVIETTALGAAYLAGLGSGEYSSLESLANGWRSDRSAQPTLEPEIRAQMIAGWERAVNSTRAFAKPPTS